MPAVNESRIVPFDGDAARDRLREATEGTLYSVLEFDTKEFNPLYLDDAIFQFYEDKDQMWTHFERIHNHVHMDFLEVNMFVDDLFPVADRVEYMVTAMDYLTLVRIYAGQNGLFLAVGPDEPVEPLVDAVRPVIDGAVAQ